MAEPGAVPGELGWGVAVPAGVDPAEEARRLERLGFSHLALPTADPVPALLALGATTELTVLVAGPLDEQPWVTGLPAATRRRLRSRPEGLPLVPLVVPVDTAAPADVAVPGGSATFELEAPLAERAAACHWLALEVLHPVGGPIRYGEDFRVGQVIDLGTWAPTQAEIIAFGEFWDPLPFHIDPVAATRSPLGVLCASGMQSQSMMHRLAVLRLHRRTAMIAGRGVLGGQLRKPVRAGMTLRVRIQVRDVNLRPDGRAVLLFRNTMRDGEDLVAWFETEAVIARRPAG